MDSRNRRVSEPASLPASRPAWLAGASGGSCLLAGVVLMLASPTVRAQQGDGSDEVAELPAVVVSASRREQRSFDAPAAIQSIGRDTIEEAGPQVNLSESINRIPGLTARNRQNYAQDLQVSIRGFGSRSTFGIRGVRLLIDGIPATMPDGQGQASTVSLGSVSRIEVLRGPLAQLYGNAAGGVIQVFTGEGAAPATAGAGLAIGSDGTRRIGLNASGRWNAPSASSASSTSSTSSTPNALNAPDRARSSRTGTGLVADYSDFQTDGYRDHSEARRRQLNAKLTIDARRTPQSASLPTVFDQPLSKDPVGLTRAQAQANPRQVVPIAVTQDARKVVSQNQAGIVAEHRIDSDRSVSARLYAGQRDLDNALSIPLAAQHRQPRREGSSSSIDAMPGWGCSMRNGSERLSAVCVWSRDSTTTP